LAVDFEEVLDAAGVFEVFEVEWLLAGAVIPETRRGLLRPGALTISARLALAVLSGGTMSAGGGIGPENSGVDSILAMARTCATAATCSAQVFVKMWVPSPRATK